MKKKPLISYYLSNSEYFISIRIVKYYGSQADKEEFKTERGFDFMDLAVYVPHQLTYQSVLKMQANDNLFISP
jgi:hypothetical protein